MTANSPSTPAMGSLFVGMVVTLFLYGLGLAQIFQYARRPKEYGCRWIRYWVASVFFINTIYILIFPCFLYIHLVANHGVPTSFMLYPAHWLFSFGTVLTGLVEVSSQLFFAWRVHRALRRPLLTTSIVILSFIAYLVSIGTAIALAITNHKEDEQWSKSRLMMISWLGVNLVVNNTTSFCLIYHLWGKRKTGMPATDDMVNHFISSWFKGFATGIVTSANTIASFVMFLFGLPTHFVFEIPMGTLCTTSVLAMLGSGYHFSDKKRLNTIPTSFDAQFTTIFTDTIPANEAIELLHLKIQTPI